MTQPTTPPPHRISPEQLTRLREILYAAPELNMANYDHEQVRLLNDAVIEAFLLVDGLCQPEAPTAHPDLPTTECLQGQPGDTCQHAFCQSVPTARPEQAKSGYAWEQWSDQVAPRISLEGAVTQPAPTAAETQARIIQLMDDARKHPAYEEQGREMAAGTPITDGAEFFVANTTRLSPDEGEMHVPSSVCRFLEVKLQAAQAEIAELHKRFYGEIKLRQETVRANQELDKQAHADTLAKLDREEDDRRKCDAMIEDLRAKLTAAEQQVEAERTIANENRRINAGLCEQVAELTRDGNRMGERYAGILSDFASARRDTERMDFLNQQRADDCLNNPTMNFIWGTNDPMEGGGRTSHLDLRQAIDLAMKQAIDAALHPSDAK